MVFQFCKILIVYFCAPKEFRTPIITLKVLCPSQLDDGSILLLSLFFTYDNNIFHNDTNIQKII